MLHGYTYETPYVLEDIINIRIVLCIKAHSVLRINNGIARKEVKKNEEIRAKQHLVASVPILIEDAVWELKR